MRSNLCEGFSDYKPKMLHRTKQKIGGRAATRLYANDDPNLVSRHSTRLHVRNVHHVALRAVAVQALALSRVVDDILRQPLADHKTNERLCAIVHRLVRGTAGWKAAGRASTWSCRAWA